MSIHPSIYVYDDMSVYTHIDDAYTGLELAFLVSAPAGHAEASEHQGSSPAKSALKAWHPEPEALQMDVSTSLGSCL